GEDPVDARLEGVFRLTFFVAEIPGVHALRSVTALDADGRVVDRMERSFPPPYRGDGSTRCPAGT
ncbi:MAG: hypothetical protein ACRDKT_18260, partial [Actinomycetota bacterium]